MRVRVLGFVLLLLGILFTNPALARETPTFNDRAFSQIPILHEGRIKPMGSFARLYYKSFSGREFFSGRTANLWLMQALFDPATSMERPLFLVYRPSLINLPERDGHRYSYEELAAGLKTKEAVIQTLLQTPEERLSTDQKDLLTLNANAILYTQLLRSFSMMMPLNMALPDNLAKSWKLDSAKPLTLNDYRGHAEDLKKRVQTILRKKGDNPDRYSEEERQVVAFAYTMEVLTAGGSGNVLLRILPPQWNDQDKEGAWLSPWAMEEAGQGSPHLSAYLAAWKNMAVSYNNGDEAAFTAASRQALSLAISLKAEGVSAPRLNLELYYNNLHPMGVAMGLYLLAFLGCVLQALFPRPLFRKATMSFLGAGAILHLAGLVSRVVILERPPVGTLYESILFVSLICVLAALLFERSLKDGTGLIAGSLSGTLLLFIAEAFAGDDTMAMLVAVLNTNFWLATHVLCITMGYGWALVAGILAHFWLAQRAFGTPTQKERAILMRAIKTLGLIALLFTTVGTILGGIWADQSWGRFWGWDPKENGALLIVLWLIWIYHGRISQHLNNNLFAALMAGTNVIVALAWFGVNLLNVGLHSYGFIQGVAASLFAFCTLEGAVIATLYIRARKRGRHEA